MKWSDGKPFTAAATWSSPSTCSRSTPRSTRTGVWSQITGVTASGNTVTFTFKAAQRAVRRRARRPGADRARSTSGRRSADPAKFANTKPVGTGPFTLDKFAPTQYTLKKNPSYWQADKIAPTEVRVPGAVEQPEHQPARRHQRQVRLVVQLPARRQADVRQPRTRKHNTYWFPPGGTIGLFLNLTKAPYNDVNFRKGISLALDRDDDRAEGGQRLHRRGQPVRA